MGRWDLFLTASEFVLGERELAVLVALAEHKILSTSQIELLFYDSPRRAQQMLFELRSHGLIHTFTWRGAGTREADRHCLSGEGARYGARSLGVRVRDLGDLPKSEAHAKRLMPHRSGVNAFFCGLVVATLGRPGYGLQCWTDEHKLRTPYGEVQPDGFGRLLHPGGANEFYFEYDLSTEHRAALRTKFLNYLRVASHWEDPDGEPFPSVLFVVPGEDRELDLLRTLLKAVGGWDAAQAQTARLPFYCSTVTRVRSGPLGPVWRDMLQRPAKRLRLDEVAAIDGSGFDLSECLGRRWRRTGADG